MRNTVNKQDAQWAGKSSKLFRCGVDEFNPLQSMDKRFIPLFDGQEVGYFPQYHKAPQVGGNKKLRTTERYFKPEPIWK